MPGRRGRHDLGSGVGRVDVADHGRHRHAVADGGQQARGQLAELRRPAGQVGLGVGVGRGVGEAGIGAVVGEITYRRELPGVPAAPSRPSTSAPSPMLGGSTYCSWAPTTISGRPSPFTSATVGVAISSPPSLHPRTGRERHLVADRVDRGHLGRIDQQHREAGDRRAVGVPGVDVAVHRGGDDLELAVAVEVAERRRGGEAGLGPVVLVLVARVVAGVRRVHRHRREALTGGGPHVHLAVEVGVDDLQVAVAEQIAHGGRADTERAAVHRDVVGHRGRRRRTATTARRRPASGKPGSSVMSDRKAWISPSLVASSSSW